VKVEVISCNFLNEFHPFSVFCCSVGQMTARHLALSSGDFFISLYVSLSVKSSGIWSLFLPLLSFANHTTFNNCQYEIPVPLIVISASELT